MVQHLFISGLIFFLSAAFCLFPRFGRRIKHINRVMPYATLLSAGFLLAVLVLDFIPHMISHDHSMDHEKMEFNTQTGLFVSGISFLLLLGIDSLVLKHDHCEPNMDEHSHSHVKKNKEGEHDHIHDNLIDHDHSSMASIDHKHSSSLEEGGCCNTDMIKNTNSKAKAFIFIIGISIHSFFEGLAFKNSESFGGYELSIIVHKILESFSIGLAFLDTMFSMPVILGFTTFYSILTPIGMMIGQFFSSKQFFIGNISVFMVCQGLALGSLMFIVFIEMISTAFHKAGSNTIKVSILTLGYLAASTMIMVMPHSHDHEHHSHSHENHSH